MHVSEFASQHCTSTNAQLKVREGGALQRALDQLQYSGFAQLVEPHTQRVQLVQCGRQHSHRDRAVVPQAIEVKTQRLQVAARAVLQHIHQPVHDAITLTVDGTVRDRTPTKTAAASSTSVRM